jgi:hypothetical protein
MFQYSIFGLGPGVAAGSEARRFGPNKRDAAMSRIEAMNNLLVVAWRTRTLENYANGLLSSNG